MSPLAAATEQSIRARGLFLPRAPILVAVSGGVDSMVLLHLLLELAPEFQWKLSVAHLNHQLRGRSSDRDAELVRKTAAQLNLPVRIERADVQKFARLRKLSIEMAARQLRHQFLAQTAARLGIRQVALAHHADDQLELFFLRLLRGSGSEGLSGMRWQNQSPLDPKLRLVRPLLEQSKGSLLEYAAAHDIPFREDATNRCVDIQRNRIRHRLLPLLRQDYQPALDKTVLRAMNLLRAEGDFIAAMARQWLDQCLHSKAKRSAKKLVRCDPLPFDQLPLALQRRTLQLQLIDLGILPEFELIEQLRAQPERAVCPRQPELAAESNPVQFSVIRDPGGLVRVRRTTKTAFNQEHKECALRGVKGGVTFAGVRIVWSKSGVRGGSESIRGSAGWERFDADRVGSVIVLRHWRAGDRFQPSGMSQPVKLQDLFTNARVPRGERHQRVVGATRAGEIFWVEGLRIAERFKLTEGTIRCLQWRWQRF